MNEDAQRDGRDAPSESGGYFDADADGHAGGDAGSQKYENALAQSLADGSEELHASLQLLAAQGIGPGRLARLVGCFGSAHAARHAPPTEFARAVGMAAGEAARALAAAQSSDVAGVVASLRAHDAKFEMRSIRGCPTDGYPELLLASPDPPWVLFAKGRVGAAPEPAVAIVGSRRASAYGRLHAGRLAEELAAQGLTIVSGGARGIDAEAHRGALRAGGRTIAVVASGFDHPYPSEHAGLYDAIVAAGGAVLSEQVPSVEPRAELFPRRNRIIAGLSLVTVVIEAAERSGALLTARIAVEDLGRDVGCVPGSVDSPSSAGCHKAIREGWATLIRNGADVCELVASARMLAVGAVERASSRVRCADGVELRRGHERASAHSVRSQVKFAATRPRVQPESRSTDRGCREAALGDAEISSRGAQIHGVQLSEDARAILRILTESGAGGLDEIERESGWSVQRIAVALLELEMRGSIERSGEGLYRAIGCLRR